MAEYYEMWSWSIDRLFSHLAACEAGSKEYRAITAEVEKRRFLREQETAEQQKRAAEATIKATSYARENADHMKNSVMILTFTMIITAINNMFQLFFSALHH